MKRSFTILTVLMLTFILSGCGKKASKLYDQGNYERAFDTALKKYEKGKKTSSTDVKLLEDAYERIIKEQRDKLEVWRASYSSSKWENIFYRLNQIQKFQNKIEPFLPIEADNGYKAKIELVNISAEKLDAGEKAAAVYYEKGIEELNKYEDYRDKKIARKAYGYFVKVNSFASGYEDVDDLLLDTEFLGTTNVLIEFDNNSRNYLPTEFRRDMDNLLDVSDEKWIKYDSNPIAGVEYDYRIILDVRSVDIDPSNNNSSERTYTKTIEDFKRDSDGKFILDADGEKIREDRTVTARVRSTTRSKYVELDMEYRLINERTLREIDSRRFRGNSSFTDQTCRVRGDKQALPSDFNCNERQPAEFPSDEQMLEEAFNDFRNDLRREINNEYYLD